MAELEVFKVSANTRVRMPVSLTIVQQQPTEIKDFEVCDLME